MANDGTDIGAGIEGRSKNEQESVPLPIDAFRIAKSTPTPDLQAGVSPALDNVLGNFQLTREDEPFDNDTEREEKKESGEKEEAERTEGKSARELQEALAERQKPYAKELTEIRAAIDTGKALAELSKKRTFNNPYNTVEIDGAGGQKLQVSDTGRQGVYVVRQGDNTYILNNETPSLDSKFKAGVPLKSDFDFSKHPEQRRTLSSMMINAKLSLDQQADSMRKTDREPMLKSSLAIVEGGHKEGVFNDKFLADELGYYGFKYTSQINNPGKGLPLSERALTLLEKTVGPSHADTINQRSDLIRDYSDNGKPANADMLLKKQIGALSDAEKDGRGLEQAIVLERSQLLKQLTGKGRKEEAQKIQERAYDLLIKNPDDRPIQDSGMSLQRRMLIDQYKTENKQPERLAKLFDQEMAAIDATVRSNPADVMIEHDRDKLINDLAQTGDKKRLAKVLDDKQASVETDAKLPGVSSEKTRTARTNLAQLYLQAEKPDKALEVARKVFAAAETDLKAADSKTIQQRLELSSRLEGLSDKDEFKNFTKKTLELFKSFEKSDAGKKNPAEVSELRSVLIEQTMERKDPKTAQQLIEDELKQLKSREPKDEAAIEAFTMKLGEAHFALGNNKEAAGIFEAMVKDAKTDRDKVDPLEKLAEAFDKLGKKDDAEKARNDAKAIRKGLPPQTYQTPLKVAR